MAFPTQEYDIGGLEDGIGGCEYDIGGCEYDIGGSEYGMVGVGVWHPQLRSMTSEALSMTSCMQEYDVLSNVDDVLSYEYDVVGGGIEYLRCWGRWLGSFFYGKWNADDADFRRDAYDFDFSRDADNADYYDRR